MRCISGSLRVKGDGGRGAGAGDGDGADGR
jgi:hypothetical protein